MLEYSTIWTKCGAAKAERLGLCLQNWHFASLSYPNGCGVFCRFFLRQKRKILVFYLFDQLKKIHLSAFQLSHLPSAVEYTPQHREQWRKYAEDSCSSSDRLMWGSLGRPLQAKKSLVGICCFAILKHHLKNTDSNKTYSGTIFLRIKWICASPLQFAKYTRTPTFWHSVHICGKIKCSRSYSNIITHLNVSLE